MAMTMTISKIDREAEIEKLRGLIPRGSTVYCILRSASRSGMSHQIGLMVMIDGHPFHPNYSVAIVLGRPLNKNGDGIRINGCGMDMGFALMNDLQGVLYPDEDALLYEWL